MPDDKRTLFYDINKETDFNKIVAFGEAISHPIRITILKTFEDPPYIMSVSMLAEKLKISKTNVRFHLDKLEQAGLVYFFYKGTENKSTYLIGRNNLRAQLNLEAPLKTDDLKEKTETQSLKVGEFTYFTGNKLFFVDKSDLYTCLYGGFYNPIRFNAELLYTPQGIITYYFCNETAKNNKITSLSLSLEICSEAPLYDNDYLSDITFWINDKEICTYISTGDFGEKRGKLNPEWWPRVNTQHGKLLNIIIDDKQVLVDNKKVFSKYLLKDLELEKDDKIKLSFGNKDTATNLGGFNIFGKNFGNYPQDIVLCLTYNNKQ